MKIYNQNRNFEKDLDFRASQKEMESRNEEIENEYNLKFKNLSRDKENLDSELKEVTKLKQRIENQLEIINIVVNEPEKIERIEDYSHSFALGNFENLKKLAELGSVDIII